MIDTVGIIKAVVDEVKARWTTEAPYFMHGLYAEMQNTLVEKDQGKTTKFQKFPCIMLVQPFDVVDNGFGYSTVTLTLIIAASSKPIIKAEERYIHTFNPTLFPLLELVKEELLYSRDIANLIVECKTTELPYWGSNGEANMGTDYVDAIELKDINLQILNNC